MRALVCLYGFLLLLQACAVADHDITGTWLRTNNGATEEILVILPDGDFISNLLNATNKIATVEKGTWEIRNDSITFEFVQVLMTNDSTQQLSKIAGELPPVTYKFSTATLGELTIGSARFNRP